MGIWDDAEKTKSTARARRHGEELTRQETIARLTIEQRGLLQELIAGFRARNIAPQRYELKFWYSHQDGSKRHSYFPKKYVEGWKTEVHAYSVVCTDGKIRATLTKGKAKNGEEVEDLPLLDKDSDARIVYSGEQFKAWIRSVAELHL